MQPTATQLPSLCQEIAKSVPDGVRGKPRVNAYAERLNKYSESDLADFYVALNSLLSRAVTAGASDVDLGGPASRGYIWCRIDGDKQPTPQMGRFDVERADVLCLGVLSSMQRETLLEECSLDFSYEMPLPDGGQQRFRATMYFDQGHLGLNMRVIANELFPLNELGFHPNIQQAMLFNNIRDGLTLVTGVTGSGKSTTLDAIIDANNETTSGHIVIIGQPIEQIHPSKQSIVRHREVGKDVRSFKEGVVQAMRQDPDIVIIGEMRDAETINAGLEVADTGHRVFSTLHTSSAVESIDRIVAEQPAWEQERVRLRLAETLSCVISQKLCPKIGGGRVLAKEVLWVTSSVSAAIKNDNAGEIYQMIWEKAGQGQITLEQDLYRLVRKKEITTETALSYSNIPKRLQQLLQSS